MKNKIHEFNPVVYPRKLWVVITDSEVFLNDNFETECDIDDFSYKYGAIVFPASLKETNDLGAVVVFPSKKEMTVKNIAHESVHIASVIFNDCNMTMGFDGGKDEHFAYLAGWAATALTM
ncbi:hypothetical protein [Bacteroides reticulotermitis]|uniref:hypothetical protein n=1 Tax=Bacteroides reticulotermitis TaxID=1133319 RepID=UPI000695EEC0|nr:hypothetical protein [Bacteroides reticulotermitis]